MPRAFSLFEGTTFNAATLLVAAISILVAVVSAFFARRALFPPKRRLVFVERSVASMLSNASHRMTGVAVTRNGETLEDPHIVVIAVENTGRHSVTSDHFDQNRPIVVDLGVPVIEIIKSSRRTKSGTVEVKCEAAGTAVSLGPDLFPGKSELDIQVMTAGRPKLVSIDDRLVDTTVLKIDSGVDGRERRRPLLAGLSAASIGVALLATALLVYGYVTGEFERRPFIYVDRQQGKEIVEEGAKITVAGMSFKPDERVRFSITDGEGHVYTRGDEVRADAMGGLTSELAVPQLDDVGRTGAVLAKVLVLEVLRENGATVTSRFIVVGV